MKVTYAFDSESEGDIEDLKIYQQSVQMWRCIWDINNEICRKYTHYEDLPEEQYKIIERIVDDIREVINTYQVNLEL